MIKFIIFVVFLIYLIFVIQNDKQHKQEQLCKEFKERNIKNNKAANRSLLKCYGEHQYKLYYGQDALNSIKNDTDTEMYYRINY